MSFSVEYYVVCLDRGEVDSGHVNVASKSDMLAVGLCLTHIRQSFQFLWGSDNPRIVFRSVTLKGVVYGFELIIVVAVCEIQSGDWVTLFMALAVDR